MPMCYNDLLEYRRTDDVMENLSNAMLSPSHARITENIFAEMFNLALFCLDIATNCTGDHQQSLQMASKPVDED